MCHQPPQAVDRPSMTLHLANLFLFQADQESTICDEPACQKHFTYFTRRHHCRRCGNIFCDPHSSFEIPLDESANFNPRGSSSRSCSHCFGQFRAWRSRNNSAASTEEASTATPTTMTPTNPVAAISTSPGKTDGAAPGAKALPEIAQSVPRDWNWSTF